MVGVFALTFGKLNFLAGKPQGEQYLNNERIFLKTLKEKLQRHATIQTKRTILTAKAQERENIIFSSLTKDKGIYTDIRHPIADGSIHFLIPTPAILQKKNQKSNIDTFPPEDGSQWSHYES